MVRACFEACLFGDESQHSVTPHVWHVRRCIHREPLFTHSEHSRFAGCFTSLIREMSSQIAIVAPAPKDIRLRTAQAEARKAEG